MRLRFDTGRGFGDDPSIGLIVLQSDETIEQEFRRLADPLGISLYHSRVPSGLEVTPDSLARMEGDIPLAAGLLPRSVDFAAIGYACTSGATMIGEHRVAELVSEVHPGVAVTNPLMAAKKALAALSARRLGFVTPYIAEVSSAMRSSLEEAGLEIAAFGSFEQSEEAIVARIAPESILDAVVRVGRAADCDAVFVSCTNLRTFDVLAEAEDQLDRPVVSSNQALAWHMLQLAGVETQSAGPGLLFDRIPA